MLIYFFFFNDTATTEIYTLSLHDALPIFPRWSASNGCTRTGFWVSCTRSEEHTSELQSQSNLVCRLLLEKKKHNTPLFATRARPLYRTCNSAAPHLTVGAATRTTDCTRPP